MLTRVMIYTTFTSPVSAKTKRHLATMINEQVSLIEKDMQAYPTNKSLNDVHREFLFNDEDPCMKAFIKDLQEFEDEHEGVYIDIWTIRESEFVSKMRENAPQIIRKYGEKL